LQADTFICGDDAAAKSVVSSLARAIGFEVIDVGPLSNVALVEALVKLWFNWHTDWDWDRILLSNC
jgi:predicted dinucleotide-binding enzyme